MRENLDYFDRDLAEYHFVDHTSREAGRIDFEGPQYLARDLMYSTTNLGGEGASTLVFQPAVTSVPGLVVWPVLAPNSTTPLDASHEIYRLAYEWAKAVIRPSRYELACRFVSN